MNTDDDYRFWAMEPHARYIRATFEDRHPDLQEALASGDAAWMTAALVAMRAAIGAVDAGFSTGAARIRLEQLFQPLVSQIQGEIQRQEQAAIEREFQEERAERMRVRGLRRSPSND